MTIKLSGFLGGIIFDNLVYGHFCIECKCFFIVILSDFPPLNSGLFVWVGNLMTPVSFEGA